MTAYKKQLLDKDGNVIYPDVGIDLDDMVYSDDPTEPVSTPIPWVSGSDILPNTISSGNIDWSNMEFQYKVTSQTLPNLPSTQYQNVQLSGWELEFNAVNNGIYEVEGATDYMTIPNTDFAEFDFALAIISGGTLIAQGKSVLTGSIGLGRFTKAIIRATSNKVKVRAVVLSNVTNKTARVDSGFISAKRVG